VTGVFHVEHRIEAGSSITSTSPGVPRGTDRIRTRKALTSPTGPGRMTYRPAPGTASRCCARSRD